MISFPAVTDPEYNTAADPGVDFVKAVARLKGGRLLLVGDLMLDEMIRGAAERLSPDAPVPVLSIDGESAGPIMSICSSVSAAAIPAPGDPMRSSAALRTVPRRCGGGVAVTGRPLSARTAAVRCGGRGTRGLGAWISVGVCESSRLMRASPPRDGCGLVSPGECSCLGRAFVTKFSTKPSRRVLPPWLASAASKRWQNESFTTLARLDRLPVACC